MFENAARKFVRKIKKIDYINTKYPDDYETVNTEYKRLRNELVSLNSVILSLSSYEVGGVVLKSFTKITNQIAKAHRLDFMNVDDMFTRIALVGEELSNTTHNSSIKSIGNSFFEAFSNIHKNKEELNEKLKNIQGSLRVLSDQSKTIDALRNEAADLRYDLEDAIQLEGKKETIEMLQKKFDAKSEESLRGMKVFMGEVGVSGILKRVAIAYKEFNSESAKALEIVK